jgi:transketolase
MTNISPLQVKNFLAAQPNTKPIYAVSVKDHKNESIDFCDPRATRAMVALMDMNAVLGGAASHYGGPAALAELWSALHGIIFQQAGAQKKNWFDLYHVINDAGHCENGLYALKANYQMAGLDIEKLKKFRSIESKLTGHGEAHLFPEGVYMSNGPLGSAFPQSQGLAIAEKLAGSNRTTICTLSDGAAMEGEAKEAMAAIPGFAAKGKCSPFVLLITDNNTKLSGRIDQDAFSMQPTFASLETLGWKVLTIENGNNLQSCVSTIESAIQMAQNNPNQPVAVWAKTIKGIGTKKTAESASGGHGFPCKSPVELPAFISEIYGTEDYPTEFKKWIDELIQIEKDMKANAPATSGEKIQKGIAKAMSNAVQKGLPLISITSDLPGSTGVADFRKEFPNHSLDVGVAESNMISVGAGFSKQGFIPVVDTFAQFGVTKGALPITMANLSEAPIIAVFSHTGFQDAADGASHQALSYMSMLSTIPHVDLYSLSSSEEADQIMTTVIDQFAEAKKNNKPAKTSVFFLGRENFPQSYSTAENQLKYIPYQPQVIKQHIIGSKNVMIVTTGSLVGEAIKASIDLEKKSMGSIVINLNCLNHIDLKTLIPLIKKCEGRIVTVEDHQVLLGLGAFLCHQLILAGENIFMKSLGVRGEFGQSAYNAIELYQKHGMDSVSISTAAVELLNR